MTHISTGFCYTSSPCRLFFFWVLPLSGWPVRRYWAPVNGTEMDQLLYEVLHYQGTTAHVMAGAWCIPRPAKTDMVHNRKEGYTCTIYTLLLRTCGRSRAVAMTCESFPGSLTRMCSTRGPREAEYCVGGIATACRYKGAAFCSTSQVLAWIAICLSLGTTIVLLNPSTTCFALCKG